MRKELRVSYIWLFTRLGFYSVTAGTDNKIQIRARNKEHLYNLKDALPKILKDKQLMTLESRDYRFRYIVTKEEWTEIAAKITSEAGDYSNFKGECGKQVDNGNLDAKYEHLLHTVWSEHMAYQRAVNFTGTDYTKKKHRGSLGYISSQPESSSLWRQKQSYVYDNDFEDEDQIIDKRDAKDILADLNDMDLLPARSQKSLFVDTDIGEIYHQDQSRHNNGGHKKKHKKR